MIKNNWIVDWIDDEHDEVLRAPFNTRSDASKWIACKYDDSKREPDGFEALSRPYRAGLTNEIKLWFDAYRKAPRGFKRMTSVEHFTDDFVPAVNRKFDNVVLLSFDTRNDKDGHSFVDVLNYFNNMNANGIKVHIHGNNNDVKLQLILRANEYGQEVVDDIDDYIQESHDINESIKIWVDDIRPAPNGYLWIKSTDDFIDYVDEHGVEDIEVFDFDHDAGDYAKDGGDYIRCLDYLEFIGADNINVRIHSANPVGRKNMQNIILKNLWNEVFDIIDEDAYDEPLDEAIDDIIDENEEELDEVEDVKKKDDIVSVLKKASKDFLTAASNNNPDQFAKIVVAFDDLIGGVGKYDFKQKKQRLTPKNKKPNDITKRKK